MREKTATIGLSYYNSVQFSGGFTLISWRNAVHTNKRINQANSSKAKTDEKKSSWRINNLPYYTIWRRIQNWSSWLALTIFNPPQIKLVKRAWFFDHKRIGIKSCGFLVGDWRSFKVVISNIMGFSYDYGELQSYMLNGFWKSTDSILKSGGKYTLIWSPKYVFDHWNTLFDHRKSLFGNKNAILM